MIFAITRDRKSVGVRKGIQGISFRQVIFSVLKYGLATKEGMGEYSRIGRRSLYDLKPRICFQLISIPHERVHIIPAFECLPD